MPASPTPWTGDTKLAAHVSSQASVTQLLTDEWDGAGLATLEYMPRHLHFFTGWREEESWGSLDAPLSLTWSPSNKPSGSSILSSSQRQTTRKGRARNCGDLPPDEHATSLNLSPSFPYPPTIQTYAIFIGIKIVYWYRNQVLMCKKITIFILWLIFAGTFVTVCSVVFVQSLNLVRPFATPWTAACQASLSSIA